jgi:hypothetical protein
MLWYAAENFVPIPSTDIAHNVSNRLIILISIPPEQTSKIMHKALILNINWSLHNEHTSLKHIAFHHIAV